MEFLEYDNHISDNELSIFMKNICSTDVRKLSIDIWEEGLSLEEYSYWDMVVDKLSKIEKCEKIIKTRDQYDDVILFISQDTSSSYISKVIDVYTEILICNDKYFNVLILNNDEYNSWKNNENNIIYWEKMI